MGYAHGAPRTTGAGHTHSFFAPPCTVCAPWRGVLAAASSEVCVRAALCLSTLCASSHAYAAGSLAVCRSEMRFDVSQLASNQHQCPFIGLSACCRSSFPPFRRLTPSRSTIAAQWTRSGQPSRARSCVCYKWQHRRRLVQMHEPILD